MRVIKGVGAEGGEGIIGAEGGEGIGATAPVDGLAAAKATILAKLWGGLAREPIPGIVRREQSDARLRVQLGAFALTGGLAESRPFALPHDDFAIQVAGPSLSGEVADPGELVRLLGPHLGPHAARLADELDNSVTNLALARAAQPAPDGGPALLDRAARQPDPLVYCEQSHVDGHPLHPCARTRWGLSSEQIRAYAPEHRAIVRLRRVAVDPDRWYGIQCPPTLLMHPYQHDRYRDVYPWLSTVDGEVPAHPLISLRTLAVNGEPTHHVKTSVDIQMTSAIRTVTPASIHNGHLLSGLMTEYGARVLGLSAAAEVGGAVLVDGEPDRHLAMVHRRLPALAPGEVALPFSVLAAPSPATGAPVVTEVVEAGYGGDPEAFVEDLARLVLSPVLGWLNLGIALEAHGQNLLAVARGGRLVRLIYRDFGGVRVNPKMLLDSGIEPPPLRGDVPTDDPEVLRTKLLAAAVASVLWQVIATLQRYGLDEARAWERVAAVARRLPGAARAGLFAPQMPIKAYVAMRLAEAAIEDIWCENLANPMAGLA